MKLIMIITIIIIITLFFATIYALLSVASKADDHAETLRDSKEEK